MKPQDIYLMQKRSISSNTKLTPLQKESQKFNAWIDLIHNSIKRDYETTTQRAENITVITNPDFDKALSELNKNYGN